MPSGDSLLPIKVVVPRQDDLRPPLPGGGSIKQFGDVDDALRSRYIRELEDVAAYFRPTFEGAPDIAAVAKVTVKPEAVAKTHRPIDLFNEKTCPIIGGNRLGEVLVSIRPEGLARIADRIQRQTKRSEANVSALVSITPYTAADALGSLAGSEELLTLDGGIMGLAPMRLKLFRHPDDRTNRALMTAFDNLVQTVQIPEPRSIPYADGLNIFRVESLTSRAVAQLATFAGTQSLGRFSRYEIARTQTVIIGDVTAHNLPPPDPTREYGLVGIIDTGTDLNNPFLQAWVHKRLDLVPDSRQNNEHGSMVAALTAQGRWLNHDDQRFPAAACKVVDVAAVEPSGIDEDELLFAIDSALAEFPEVRVWNLSLGFHTPCENDQFSDIATALDERAKRYKVLFVIAAGNYQIPPFRSWPLTPSGPMGDTDRICPPADALYGITVASIAHRDTPRTCVLTDAPSPFSRRGPAPGYLTKPELAHFGGNCDALARKHQTGILTVDGQKHLVEDVGTSLATPLVSAIEGALFHELQVGIEPPSPLLVKAMTIHAAFVRNGPPTSDTVNYVGVGIPPDPEDIIHCRQEEATIIIQASVRDNLDFLKNPFPMPQCLISGSGLKGEVFMTLLYEPPVDSQSGVEYCRTNVNASLGTLRHNSKTDKDVYTREIHPVPRKVHAGYEANLVEYGYKWSPLKLYHRAFTDGPANKTWRLRLDVMHRSGFLASEDQQVILLITIRARFSGINVYDELVREMNRLSWGAQDLAVRSRPRLQA